MLIISKAVVMFHRNGGAEQVRVPITANGMTQEVPDWIRDDDYFQGLSDDGIVMEVAPVVRVKSKSQDAADDAQDAADDVKKPQGKKK